MNESLQQHYLNAYHRPDHTKLQFFACMSISLWDCELLEDGPRPCQY